MRCLGIPARVITNFNSAHDNNGNLVTELILYSDGALDTANTKDSVWWVQILSVMSIARRPGNWSSCKPM